MNAYQLCAVCCLYIYKVWIGFSFITMWTWITAALTSLGCLCLDVYYVVWPIVQGTLTNETRCLRCETITARDETFLDLSLDIEQNSSITSCLRNFSSTETLNAEDKFFCDKCCRCEWFFKSYKCQLNFEYCSFASVADFWGHCLECESYCGWFLFRNQQKILSSFSNWAL